MTWRVIRTEQDIHDFMTMYGYFHDSCIKEMRYVSGSYVDEDLSMMPTNDKRDVYIIFQRQYKDPTVIEMCFSKVERLNLLPTNEVYTSEIFEAHFSLRDGMFYWSDDESFDPSSPECDACTWISSIGVKWRAAEELVGK